MTTTIAWTCDSCGSPVADGAGYVHVSRHAIHRHELESREAKERIEDRLIVSAADLLDFPCQVSWHVHHADCDPDPEAFCYWFTVERARTHAALLDWTAHLMNKRWIDATNWSDFIRRALRGGGER